MYLSHTRMHVRFETPLCGSSYFSGFCGRPFLRPAAGLSVDTYHLVFDDLSDMPSRFSSHSSLCLLHPISGTTIPRTVIYITPYHDSRIPSLPRRNSASRFWLFYCGFSTHLLFIYTYMRSRLQASYHSSHRQMEPCQTVPGGRLTCSFSFDRFNGPPDEPV